MDQANTLIRTVVRSFHASPTAHKILIVDALVTHSVLSHDDLTSLLGPQRKELNRLLQPLRAARLITSHTRQETRDGYSKAVPREYFYINYHTAIDTIKYQVWQLQNEIKKQYDVDEKTKAERPFWICRTCGKDWTEMGVLHLATPEGVFLCDRCNSFIEQANEGKAADDPALMVGHEKLARLNAQLEKITNLLRKIDRLEVPENTFEAAWERRKEIPGGSKTYLPAKTAVGTGLKTAKAGSGKPEQTDAKNLSISLTTSEELSTAEQAEKDRRKEELARQNAKPIWITESTVGGNTTSSGASNLDPTATANATTAIGTAIKTETPAIEDVKPDAEATDDADMRDYWAALQREKEEADRKADEEENEDDDDEDEDEDDEEFEDVPGSSVPVVPSPSPGPGLTPSPMKRDREEDGEGRSGRENGVKKVKGEVDDGRTKQGIRGGGDGTNGVVDVNVNVKAEEEGSSDEDAFEDVDM